MEIELEGDFAGEGLDTNRASCQQRIYTEYN